MIYDHNWFNWIILINVFLARYFHTSWKKIILDATNLITAGLVLINSKELIKIKNNMSGLEEAVKMDSCFWYYMVVGKKFR